MTVREIQGHLQEMYGTEISPSLISSVTDAVIEEVKAWQSRPLETLYPIVYLDCIHVKVLDNGAVRVKAVYLAVGIKLVGSPRLKSQSSGYRSSPNSRTVACRTSSSPVWMA
jgi:putative transposase